MALLTLLAISPQVNPDRMFVKVTPAANYVQTVQDTFDMTNIADGGTGLSGQTPLVLLPAVTPTPYNENLLGYYTTIQKGTTLKNYGIRYWTPGGTEVATGAMPAAITGGELTLEILLPVSQT